MRLENKIAIITGAGSGMGRAASLLFAKEGAKIAAIDINVEAAEDTAKQIKSAAGNAFAMRGDVSLSADTDAMVAETIKRFGVPNILYNNAGIEGEGNFTAQLSEEAFDRVIAINLRGVWLGMKYALPEMIKRGGGSVISTASIAGIIGLKGSVAYSAAKAGVIGMTRVIAMEYGRYNIRANCICPGGVDTPIIHNFGPPEDADWKLIERLMSPIGFAYPHEVAGAFAYLGSSEADYITGAILSIDGAITT